MITLTMNAGEIFEHFAKDNKDCSKQLVKIRKDWESYRSSHNKTVRYYKIYQFENEKTKQKYVYVMYNLPRVNSGKIGVLFAVVVEGKRVLYVRQAASKDAQVVAISDHLFVRYSERMEMNETEVLKIIGAFGTNNYIEQRVYCSQDKTKVVYAIRDGLLLGHVDTKKDICYYRTFVSRQMLKETQNAAYSEVGELFDELDDTLFVFLKCGASRMFEQLMCRICEKVTDNAQELYAKFFE